MFKDLKEIGIPFATALYKYKCVRCKGEYGLEWEAIFDADSPGYNASCCGLDYYMKPETMTIIVTKEYKE